MSADPSERPVSTTITVGQQFYDNFNQAILSREGVPFDILAADRPTDAYKLLTGVLGTMVETSESITDPNGNTVSKVMDGEQAVAGYVKASVEEATLDTDTESFDVVVSVFQKAKLWDVIRGRRPEPKEVLRFHVEPPNLAF